jgi:hypothetical protein
MRGIFLLSCIFALCSQALYAEIYRYIDENGRTVYSDKAPKSAEPITLPTLNTAPAIDINEPKRTPKKAVNLDRNIIRISSPSDGAIIANGLVGITVSISTARALRKGQQIRISLDGELVSTSTSMSATISRLPRGQRRIKATLLDQNSKTLSEDSISITVYWPTN